MVLTGCGGSESRSAAALSRGERPIGALSGAPGESLAIERPTWPGFPLLPDGRFPISAWCAPPIWETHTGRYREYAEAGFNVVLRTVHDPYRPSYNQERLEVADSLGLWVLVRDQRVHPDEPRRPGWKRRVSAMVQSHAEYPALLGYFLADEPRPRHIDDLAVLHREVARLDPEHPSYVNLLGLSPHGYGYDGTAYSTYLSGFLDRFEPSFFSIDLYTMRDSGDTPNFAAGLDTVRILAEEREIPWWAILQLTPHRDFRDLTEPELDYQAHLALAHGADGLVWFTYWTPKPGREGYRDGPIAYDGSRNPLYEVVKRVNHRVEPLGRELARLACVDVRHTGRLPRGGRPLDGRQAITFAGPGDLTIGFFREPGRDDGGGPTWALVVNRDYRRALGRVEIVGAASLRPWLGETGGYGEPAGTFGEGGWQLDLTLPPGGARLLRIDPAG